VLISGTQVKIVDLGMDDEVISSYLGEVSEEHRAETVITALRIGLQALNRSMDHVMLQNVNEARNRLVNVLEAHTNQVTKNTDNLSETMNKITDHFVKALRNEYIQYFGNENGRVRDTFAKMQKEMKDQVENLTNQVLKQFDPEGSESIPEKMKEEINKTWDEQAQAFKNILSKENPDNPLAEMAKENKDWQKTMEKEMQGLKNEVTSVMQKIAEEKGAKEERVGTPKEGRNFESAVHETLSVLSRPFGDILDDCSGSPGNLGTSKVGDHLITVNGDDSGQIKGYVAWESKNRSKQIKKESELVAMLDQVAENRGADIAVLVVPTKDVLPSGYEDFHIHNTNRIVCVYDSEDLLPLEVAYKYSRAVAKLQSSASIQDHEGGITREKLEKYKGRIMASLKELRKTNTSINTIKKESEKVKGYVKTHQNSIMEIIEEMEEEYSADSKPDEVEVEEDSENTDL